MNTLVIIPARGGSKGLPKKNIKKLDGKPLIHYSIEVAQQVFNDKNICVSTDSEEISKIAAQTNLNIPFLRPARLATDTSTSEEVILHSLEFYALKGVYFDTVLLLQPTSPFRKKEHLQEIISLYKPEYDMIISVKETDSNPYYVLAEEGDNGYLQKSKKGEFTRRQDCPTVYEYNGSMYLINVNALKNKGIKDFNKIKKYVMDSKYSVDIDTQFDFDYAEFLIKR